MGGDGKQITPDKWSYNDGKGSMQDYGPGSERYHLGTEQRSAKEQCDLAAKYDRGRRVARDYMRAAELYKLAKFQARVRAIQTRCRTR